MFYVYANRQYSIFDEEAFNRWKAPAKGGECLKRLKKAGAVKVDSMRWDLLSVNKNGFDYREACVCSYDKYSRRVGIMCHLGIEDKGMLAAAYVELDKYTTNALDNLCIASKDGVWHLVVDGVYGKAIPGEYSVRVYIPLLTAGWKPAYQGYVNIWHYVSDVYEACPTDEFIAASMAEHSNRLCKVEVMEVDLKSVMRKCIL